jgi:hypothetical protein
MPWLRIDPRRVVPPDEVGGLPRRAIPIAWGQACRMAPPIQLMVFPAYAPERLELRRCPPSEAALELLRHCVDFDRQRERALRATAALARALPAVRLRYEDADRAAELIAMAHERPWLATG